MKHISSFLCILTLGIGFHMTSCSSDELVLQYSPRAQLLLEKSQEFANKYKVKMWLNEENAEWLATWLTVEQMEKDYQTEASRKIIFSKSFDANGNTTEERVDTIWLPRWWENDSIRTDSVK